MGRFFYFFIFVSSMLFAEVNFSDPIDIDKLAIAGLKTNIKNIDKSSAGLWYLVHLQSQKWDKFRNDEFEIDGAITQAYPLLINDIEKYQSFISSSTNILLSIEFGDYDFSKEGFPLNNLMSTKHWLQYTGKNVVRPYGGDLHLVFENANNMHLLSMAKDEAKMFLQKRKSGSYVNRKLTAKYYFKILSIDTPYDEIIGCSYSKGDNRSCNSLKPKVTSLIEKIEIIDEKNKDKVLAVYNY